MRMNGQPFADENERAALCVELVYAANEAGIENERIWLDGVVTPVNIQQPQAVSLMDFMVHLRPILNQTYMVMLMKNGMYSVISDPLDDKLTDIARGNRQDIVDVIYGVMDGQEPDMAGLSKELKDYVNTTRVILGKSLYSDSWLEI